MIDIHSHILCGVDDGPKTIEETKALLEHAYKQGVRTIVSTSHRRKGMFETSERVMVEQFQVARQLAKEVAEDLTLLFGAEIYYTSDVLEKLEKGKLPTLNGTRYALIEFSMNTAYRDMHAALTKLLMQGITPVIAHIERYHELEGREDRVEELIDMGCYTQINSASVLKPKLFGDDMKFMKKRAQYFLGKGLVHVVASDMHNLDQRPSYMKKAFQIIASKYGEKRAKDLFINNPMQILQNKEL